MVNDYIQCTIISQVLFHIVATMIVIHMSVFHVFIILLFNGLTYLYVFLRNMFSLQLNNIISSSSNEAKMVICTLGYITDIPLIRQ